MDTTFKAASRLSMHSNVGVISLQVVPDEHSGYMQRAETPEAFACRDLFHLGVYSLSEQWHLASV